MTKEELKQYIDQNIYENVDGDISGDSLNEVLKAIVDDGGTKVEANPSGEATEPLNTIKIGETTYKTGNPFAGKVEATDAERIQALANVSNQDAGYDSSEPPVFTGKMGYVVLQPEKAGDVTTSFTAQIANKPNTIFEIRDVFDLGDPNGENPITIPVNCTLKFAGGRLDNGTLVFNDTRLDGYGSILCDYSGSVIGKVDARLFGLKQDDSTFDNAPIIEKLCNTFNNVDIDGTKYFCSSEIELNGDNKQININADLTYISSNTSNTFLTIIGFGNIVNINGQIVGPATNLSGDEEQSIGVMFTRCFNSVFFVKEVCGFATCIQVYGDSTGVSYSKFNFDFIHGGKKLVHLYAAGNNGWITSSVFSIYRLTNLGNYPNADSALIIESDVQKTFTDVVVTKLCVENIKGNDAKPILIKNVRDVRIENVRLERNNEFWVTYPNNNNPGNFTNMNNATVFLKNARSVKFTSNYNQTTVKVLADSNATNIENSIFDPQEKYVEYYPMKGAKIVGYNSPSQNYDNYFHPNAISINKEHTSTGTKVPLSAARPIGFMTRLTRRPITFTSLYPFILVIVFYDENKAKIAKTDDRCFPSGTTGFSYNTDYGYYVSNNNLNSQDVVFNEFPGNARYIGFFFYYIVSYNPIFLSSFAFKINIPIFLMDYIDGESVIAINDSKKYGYTKQRPNYSSSYKEYYTGEPYYDRTLGKMIFPNGIGSTTVWIDADGYPAERKRGATSDRPTLTSSDFGFEFFDTDLGKYICWNGTDWVNFDGTYMVTLNIGEHIETSNDNDSAKPNKPYTTTLTAESGFTIDTTSVVVTMGGQEQSDVYDSGTGVITIPSVTGNIVITATATQDNP